jgi:lipid-binding SYLF domain-containing protein
MELSLLNPANEHVCVHQMEKDMKAPYLTLSLVLFAASLSLAAPVPRGVTVDDAIDVLEDFDAPEKRIPPALLCDASAVIIAPDMLKGGFIVAGRHGHGVLLVRQKGGWSDPIFVSLTGGSVGWQAGVATTDLFLVIRNGKSLERIIRGAGKLTLGADASVAAGPIGREAAAATDAQLRAEILSYSRSRGFFAGVSLEGDTIQVDHPANDRYYGKRRIRVADIVEGKETPPKSASVLKARLENWCAEETTRRPPPVGVPSKK